MDNIQVGQNKLVKEKVRTLRLKGLSFGQIQLETGLSKSTISLWTKDIVLSPEQRTALINRAQKALQEGRLKAQTAVKAKKVKQEKFFLEKGVNEVGELTSREIFLSGIALYWAEGFKNKHEHRLGFCNSDPAMVRFYVNWLEKSLGLSKKDLVARLTLNKSYEYKAEEIEGYWSKAIGIPLSQFTKPFYQNSVWKKQYNNNNYYGVLRIHVKNSLSFLLKMRGWIEGLKLNMPG